MDEKVLDLKLKYKNKFLDNARYLRDFKTKFQIGSSKNIFWQILDKSFPSTYTLVSKNGKDFNLYLRKDMQVFVKKDGRELSKEELQSANLIKGNILQLKRGTEGEISFSNDWKIEYSYITPYVYKPSREEIAIAKQFAHWSPKTKEQKFTNTFLILALFITFLGLYIAKKNYVAPVKIDFAERLQRIEELSTQVEAEVVEEPVQEQTSGGPASEEETAEEVTEAQAMSSADFESEFGMSLGEGIGGGTGEGDFSNELLEVTQMEEIVAATIGGGSGSGGGSGPGPGEAGGGFGDLDAVGVAGVFFEL